MASILVVDDDALIREMTRHWLHKAGYDVEGATNGQVAVMRYRQQPLDLVITDVMMPVMEGLETIRELYRLDPAVRIVAMTGACADRAETYLSVARDFGARAILRKPFTKDQFLAAVEEVLAT